MRVGAIFPQTEVPPDAAMIRDYAQAIEGMGFDHLVAYDHVVGADITDRPDWPTTYTNKSLLYEPLLLLGFMAGVTKTLELATGVLILSQRQTALVAKQASNLDVLCGGRLRLGIGTGSEALEYGALGVPFAERGRRLDEQIDVLRAFWTQDSVSFEGRYHKIPRVGMCPPPVQRPIPLWIGGSSPVAVKRAATKGDGWIPVLPAAEAKQRVAAFHDLVKAAGRDPAQVGVENVFAVSVDRTGGEQLNRLRSAEKDAEHCRIWQEAGATHVSIHAPVSAGLSFPAGHIEYLRNLMASFR